MKAGWKSKTLNEICQFSNGLWKGEKPPFIHVGVIRNTNFTKEGALDDSDIAYLDVETKKYETRSLKFGDIILEKSGGGPKQPVGRVILFDKTEGDFSFSNFTAALRVLDEDEMDFRFLHKFLFWTYISGVTEGIQSNSTGIRNLDGNAYKAINMAFPNLPEQQRIVAILDEAFDGIATAKINAEKNLKNARELFESHLQSVFTQRGDGWVEKTLGDVCDLFQGLCINAKTKHLIVEQEVSNLPLLRIKDLRDNSAEIFISKTGWPTNAQVTESEIIYTRTGQVGLVFRGRIGILHNNCFKVKPRSVLNESYLFWWLQNPVFKEKIMTLSLKAAQPDITHSLFKVQAISVPPLKYQNKVIPVIEQILESIKRLESIYQQKITALDELKKSLLHKAFSGQL